MKLFTHIRTSVIILVIANLLTLGISIYQRWSLFEMMVLYWSESAIIGFFNILRMLICQNINGKAKAELVAAKLFMIPFFCVHYGIFMFGHWFSILVLFNSSNPLEALRLDPLNMVTSTFPDLLLNMNLLYAGLCLFASHSYSFLANYINKKEYQSTNLQMLMLQPYGRIIIMHLTIIFGGAFIMFLGAHPVTYTIVVILKILVDSISHIQERKKLQKSDV